MGTGGDVSNVAAAVRALILGFWLGLMSGGSNAAPTSLFTPEEDAWERFDRGITGLASVFAGFERNQPSEPDKRSVFP